MASENPHLERLIQSTLERIRSGVSVVLDPRTLRVSEPIELDEALLPVAPTPRSRVRITTRGPAWQKIPGTDDPDRLPITLIPLGRGTGRIAIRLEDEQGSLLAEACFWVHVV